MMYRVLRSGRSRRLAAFLQRMATLLTVISFLSLPQCCQAEDLVIVTRTQPPGESRRRGTIVEYTGQVLTLRLSSGRDEQIESSRVTRYETERVPDHRTGDQLFAEDRFAEAIVSYRRAVNEVEQRRWMRRVILAQMARCYRNMQQIDRAGETFLAIVRSDPTTQLLDALPLAWVASAPPADLVDDSTRWLETEGEPVVQLMGASWLLTTTAHKKAIDVLTKVAESPDRRIATLAEAQLWRDKLVTASREEIERWEHQLDTLDDSLRAGPYFLIGQAWARHGRHASAALALLRVPVLYPQDQNLAAEALLAAGDAARENGGSHGSQNGVHRVDTNLQEPPTRPGGTTAS